MEKQTQPIALGRPGRVVWGRFGQNSSRFGFDYPKWHALLAGATDQGTPTAEAAIGSIVDIDPASSQMGLETRQSA
jgi:hypothetical protein